MCLLVFSFKKHPRYDLIVAANRDENHKRPARAADFWDSYPRLLAGKDLEAGGTWMGVTAGGAFAAITNYRESGSRKEDAPSRGHLVLDYLKDEMDPDSYLRKVDGKAEQYAGFNLLTGNSNEMYYYSNRERNIRRLEPGLYGISNHLLDTPWPKVLSAKRELAKAMENGSVSEEALFDLLSDEREALEENLPDTGIPKELEKRISPIFIKNNRYGTRCSTVLLVDKKGKVTFEERRFKAGTHDVDEVGRYEFDTESNRRYG